LGRRGDKSWGGNAARCLEQRKKKHRVGKTLKKDEKGETHGPKTVVVSGDPQKNNGRLNSELGWGKGKQLKLAKEREGKPHEIPPRGKSGKKQGGFEQKN